MYSRYHYRMGPVADPGPDPWGPWPPWEFGWQRPFPFPPGAGGDPAPPFAAIESLLTKEAQVHLRVKQLDVAIQQIQGQLDVLKMARDTMAKEHGLG